MSSVPTELLGCILGLLDVHDLLTCRAVCSLFRELVDSSPSLQYIIELAIAGQEDGVNHSLFTRRRLLRRHQHNWGTLHWTQDQHISMFRGGLWELYGNVLAQITPDRDTLHFKQLPSQSRAIEEKDWTVGIGQFRVRDFGIDPAQDLLIIIEEPQGVLLDHYRIYLRALTTGEPHPLASGSRVLTHGRFWGDGVSYSIQTCGDTLAIMFDSDEDDTAVLLWNWKTGQVLANIVSDEINSMAFLSERHLMLGVAHLDGDTLESKPYLVVVDFIAEPSERRELDTLENAFTFHFPRLGENAILQDIRIRSDPAPIWTPNPKLAVPFFTARHNRLYVVTICIMNQSWQTVLLYALGNTFLSLIKQAGGKKNIAWDRWGPDGSRMMISPRTHSRTWVCYVYGTKCVSTIRKGRTRRIYMYDFNQPALRHTQCQDARRSDTSNAVEVEDDDLEERLVCITAPTVLEAGETFGEDVSTRLGYRVGGWGVPGVLPLDAMCNEDGLVLVQDAEGAGEYRVLSV